jgi:hypothetical protein
MYAVVGLSGLGCREQRTDCQQHQHSGCSWFVLCLRGVINAPRFDGAPMRAVLCYRQHLQQLLAYLVSF